MAATDEDRLVLPIRMVNEFVYCPRLFYYEFVEGVFVHNADTLRGKAQHRRQDAGKGGLKPVTEEDAPETLHSRSVQLGSAELGVTGKLDLVRGEADGNGEFLYSPVEYKKGAPREGEDGIEIWPADRVQLGLQVLLLRENGFPSEEGLLYYRETRQRVPLQLDAETEAWIRETVAAARSCAGGPLPPPLDHSPKCPRCSLVGICLPDETRMVREDSDEREGEAEATFQMTLGLEMEANRDEEALQARLDRGPFAALPEIRLPDLRRGADIRRLIAPNPETRALYLNTPGHYVSKKDNTLVIKEKQEKIGEFRFHDLHHLALFGPVQLSTAAVHALCDRNIPITYFSMGGWFYGMTRGHGLTNVLTRIEQFSTAADPAASLAIARSFVHGKIRNQRTLLMRNHVQVPRGVLRALKHLAASALHAASAGHLLGIEGAAAGLYFEHFAGMIKAADDSGGQASPDDPQETFPFVFRERNRRPPRDPVNALLSLAYSLLAKDCVLAAYATGLDPYVGFYHRPRYGKPALALDLMEEFRPLVAESAVLRAINKRSLTGKDFIRAGRAVTLAPTARKRFFTAYEQRLSEGVTHPVFGYKVCYRRAIELQARMLAKTLTGDIPRYLPFLTR